MTIPDYVKNAAQQECNNFVAEQTGALAAVISSADGFDIASAVTRSLDPARIAAMASSIAAIGSVVSQETQLGTSKSVTVNTQDGVVYIANIELQGVTYILNIIANSSAILAQIIYHCGEIGKRLKAL